MNKLIDVGFALTMLLIALGVAKNTKALNQDAQVEQAMPRASDDDDDSDCCEELLERLEVVERIMSWQQSSGSASLYWHQTIEAGPAWQCITNGLDTSYVTNWELVEEDCP